ncbi:MAG TPA: cyclic nucleotide-binding domain-containing protein [Kofleriaceae bacterium]|nr:cyclic nucleotide-binding domain-containing protein [Kofleriaceae bacterium]
MGPRVEHLRLVPLFRGFSDDELGEISALFEPARVRPDHSLFDTGEPATELYLLATGEVTLLRPNDDLYRLRPPALIGELGALTGLPRSCRAEVSADAELWGLSARKVQAYFADNQELGVRFLVNLLEVVADKVHRDQRRLGDMRQHLVKTQKSLKQIRDLILESPETPLSAPIHDSVESMIAQNRRVNYRVEPPGALRATFRLDAGAAPVVELSRTQVVVEWPGAILPARDDWFAGVLDLAGTDVPASGKVIATDGKRATIELDLFVDEYAQTLEGYLTRVQLLDVLV